MKNWKSNGRLLLAGLLTLILTGCLEDSNPGAEALQIEFTNPAGAEVIQTPDIVVNITGTASSDSDIQKVSWVNDRGGRGDANGREQWVTGNIVLQLGTNNITITATDEAGVSSNKSLTVERENTSAPPATITLDDEPTVAFSYSSDVRTAAPIDGATLNRETVYLFFDPGSEWTQRGINEVRFRCCEGISGAGEDDVYGSPVTTRAAPWMVSMDLSQLAADTVYRLSVYAVFNDGSESSRPFFDFRTNVEGEQITNRAPSISGRPATVTSVGNQYNFRPVATDPDGDTMRFSISNKPSWATFDSSTGRLFGTPGSDQVGDHNDIVISVSDGSESASLPSFSIRVESFANGSITLNWQPPSERTDDSPLLNLAGYNLYYGQTPGDYANRVKIDNSGLTSYMVDNLSSGDWYFVITAYDRDGIESNPSNQIATAF